MSGVITPTATQSRHDKLRACVDYLFTRTSEAETASTNTDDYPVLLDKFYQATCEAIALGGGSGTGEKPVTVVAYAATVTPAADTYGTYEIGALTGNLTLGAPTGTVTDGQKLSFRLTQDGTGGRTLTWNAAYQFGIDLTSAMITTVASSSTHVKFEWIASASKWRCIGILRQA